MLEINVIPVQLEDESSITNAKRTLEEITSGLDEEITKATIANHITSRWSKIPSTPRPILTKVSIRQSPQTTARNKMLILSIVLPDTTTIPLHN